MDYLLWFLFGLLVLVPILHAFWNRQRENEMEQWLADRDPRRIKLGRSSAKARASAAMIRTPHLFVDPTESLSDQSHLDLSSTFDSGSSSAPDYSEPISADNNCGDGNNQSAGDCGNWGDSSFSGTADSGFSGGGDFSSSSDCGGGGGGSTSFDQ